MPVLRDLIRDTTTTTGTGAVTPSGSPPSGFFAFSTLPAGSEIDYVESHQTLNEVEIGRGLWTGSVIQKLQVYESSNADALVNFSAGTKDIRLTVASRSIVGFGSISANLFMSRSL